MGIMPSNFKLASKDLALTICFAALYAVLSFLPLNPLIGAVGKAITAATIIAPIIGILLEPYLSVSSTLLGGVIALAFSPFFSVPSLVAGVVAALCAGLLFARRRLLSALLYGSLMILYGFHPFVGSVWLFPAVMWLQVIGFLVLISPLQSMAIKYLHSDRSAKLSYSFIVTIFTATMASQIAGTLVFELMYWPAVWPDVAYWKYVVWPGLTFTYPVERAIITVIASLVGVALYKTLKSGNLLSILDKSRSS
jgi:hypothetical protein